MVSESSGTVKLDTVNDEYEILMNSLGVSVSRHLVNEHFTVIWANSYYYSMFGYTKEEYECLFDNQCDRFFVGHEDEWDKIGVAVMSALERGDASYSCIVPMPCKNGSTKWIKLNGTFTDLVVDGAMVAYTVMTDVDDLMNTQQALVEERKKLETLAFVDPVTEGANKMRFDLDAGQVLKQAAPDEYALVSLDVEKFKLLNDLFGIENGNKMLKFIHETIADALDEGELAGHLAADEFNVLMKYRSRDNMLERLDAMVEEINGFASPLDRSYYMSLVAGVYVIDSPDLAFTSIRDRANVARKNAKASLRDRWFRVQFYSEQDRLSLVREKTMENRMRSALNNGEFTVYLQPKVRLSDNAIMGAEALVRWIDPEEGLIPPNEFIPLFERNGFIVELDLSVFEQVCVYLRGWIDEGNAPVPISVNVSRVHLRDLNFLDRYEDIRKKYDVPSELLELELTETMAFDDVDALIKMVDRIHELGYRCSMDDFGSGYSSLNILKELDVDTLKIDGVFFSDRGEEQERGWAVVSSVVDLAQRLEMGTVAEGVEQCDQVARLKEASCDAVQGYVFSRPVPVIEFEKLLFGE